MSPHNDVIDHDICIPIFGCRCDDCESEKNY